MVRVRLVTRLSFGNIHGLLLSADGMGELQYASNDIYRGHWKDGFRHGKVGHPSSLVSEEQMNVERLL